jgi:acyl-CoA reductase-like NAD-dependent aldehyde dehydrogenase
MVTGADPEMKIMQDEIFGPVLTAFSFTDEAKTLADVNSTTYGLSGSDWTQNIHQARRIGKQVDSDQVGINTHAAVCR